MKIKIYLNLNDFMYMSESDKINVPSQGYIKSLKYANFPLRENK